MFSRRDFLKASIVLGVTPHLLSARPQRKFFKIALSEYSFQNSLKKGLFTHLDFPSKAAALEIDAVDLGSQFFMSKEKDGAYIKDLLERLKNANVKAQSLMIDEGSIGSPSIKERQKFTSNIQRWMDVAKALDCKSVTVNYVPKGDATPSSKLVADSINELADFATPLDLKVLVRNNSLAPTAPKILTDVFLNVKKMNAGIYMDVSRAGTPAKVDKYKNLEIVSPFTKVFCANSYDFNAQGEETSIEFAKMLELVDAALYKEYISIQYQGKKLSEEEGIKATRTLLLAKADKM